MTDRASRLTRPALMWGLPLAIVGVFSVLLALPFTREAAVWSLGEHRPVELLSFALLMVGGVWGLRLAWRLRAEGAQAYVWAFFGLFAVGLLVIGMEEVAWGQWFFHFATPDAIASVNTQGELTLHNHEALNDHLEVFPLLFGVAGLVGIWLGRFRMWAPVAPSAALWVWFAIIAGVSAVDLLQDFYVLQADFDDLVNLLDEAIEMMVAAAGLLYIALRALQPADDPDAASLPTSQRAPADGLREPAPSARRTASARSAASRLPM